MRIHLVAAAAAAFILSPAFAHEAKLGDLLVEHPWSRATPAGAPVAGGFLAVANRGPAADRLVSARFERSNRVEIHEMAHKDGVMVMRELPKGIEIPAGGRVELKPGGYHLMFMELKAPLKEGEMLKGTLVFEKAGSVDVEFKVEPVGARTSDGHGHSKP